jgi:hypothetical protein
MKLSRKVGATSEIWQVFVRDSSSTTGGGLTGLTNASASLTAYYHRDTDTTATVINLVTMTVGTFTSSGFKEIDSVNMPGWYQFCPPNAALASGAKSCAFHLKGATNMAPLPIEVDLDSQVDVSKWNGTAVPAENTAGVPLVDTARVSGTAQTARDLGLALPAAAAGASGGLLINGSNSGTVTLAALTVSGATTLAAFSCTTLTASGAVAFQSTFAVTTSTALAALSCTTLTASGAVAFQSTFATTGTTTFNALTVTNATNLAGAVTFGSTWGVTGAVTFTAGLTSNITGNLVGTVSTLTTYTGNTPQTGDSFARIGATGSGLTSLAQASVWTSTLATHLDAIYAKLPANAIADETLVINATTAILAAVGTPAQSSQIPANFTAATFASAGVFATAALANAPSGGGGGSLTAQQVWEYASRTLSAGGLDGVSVESGLNARQALAVIASAVAGVLAGAAGSSVTIAAAGVSGTNRITATVDSSGNRSAVTLSPPA